MASIRAGCNPAASRPDEPNASVAFPPARLGSEDAPLDLETTSAVLEHGLLMVFGPDGDPLPPRAFCIAAADRPDAGIRTGTDARVAASRVAAVLEAQSTGRLTAGEGEAGPWEIMLSGDEIRISIAGGASLLISPARPERAAAARYRLTEPEGTPVPLGDVRARLRGGIAGGADRESAAPAPTHIPGCSLAWRDQSLVLTAGSIRFHLSPAPEMSPDETTVDLLSRDREPLLPRDLALAVRASVFDPSEPVFAFDEPGEPVADGGCAVAAGAVMPMLPETMVLGPEGVLDLGCLVGAEGLGAPLLSASVAGLPEVAMLSCGAEDGNGVWRLAAHELPGLALFAIPEGLADFELTFTFRTAGGEISRSMRIEIERAVENRLGAASGPPLATRGEPEVPMPGPEAHLIGAERFGPAETAMVIVAGLPAGAALSSGVDNGDGSWSVPGEEAGEIGVALPAGDVQGVRVVLTAIRIGGRDGGLATMSREIVLSPGEPIRLGLLDEAGPDQDPAAFSLDLHDVVGDLAGGGKLDAIVVGGLPSGAGLSQGTYDEAIASWILRPDQLAGLTLGAVQAGRFDLKVTAVAIDRATGKSHAHTRRVGFDLDVGRGSGAPCRAAGGVGFFRPLGSRRGLV
jgi:hypothetical protein